MDGRTGRVEEETSWLYFMISSIAEWAAARKESASMVVLIVILVLVEGIVAGCCVVDNFEVKCL